MYWSRAPHDAHRLIDVQHDKSLSELRQRDCGLRPVACRGPNRFRVRLRGNPAGPENVREEALNPQPYKPENPSHATSFRATLALEERGIKRRRAQDTEPDAAHLHLHPTSPMQKSSNPNKRIAKSANICEPNGLRPVEEGTGRKVTERLFRVQTYGLGFSLWVQGKSPEK